MQAPAWMGASTCCEVLIAGLGRLTSCSTSVGPRKVAVEGCLCTPRYLLSRLEWHILTARKTTIPAVVEHWRRRDLSGFLDGFLAVHLELSAVSESYGWWHGEAQQLVSGLPMVADQSRAQILGILLRCNDIVCGFAHRLSRSKGEC